MILPALIEAAERGELLLVDGGFCRFHRRKDGVVTIRELFVLPSDRKRDIGRQLVEWVQAYDPGATLRARCPQEYESNSFWEHLGFVKVKTEGAINVWERSP